MKGPKGKKKEEDEKDDEEDPNINWEKNPLDPKSHFYKYYRHKAIFYYHILENESENPARGHDFKLRVFLN